MEVRSGVCTAGVTKRAHCGSWLSACVGEQQSDADAALDALASGQHLIVHVIALRLSSGPKLTTRVPSVSLKY